MTTAGEMDTRAMARASIRRAVEDLKELLADEALAHGDGPDAPGWRAVDIDTHRAHLLAHVREIEAAGVGTVDADSGRLTLLHVAARALFLVELL